MRSTKCKPDFLEMGSGRRGEGECIRAAACPGPSYRPRSLGPCAPSPGPAISLVAFFSLKVGKSPFVTTPCHCLKPLTSKPLDDGLPHDAQHRRPG